MKVETPHNDRCPVAQGRNVFGRELKPWTEAELEALKGFTAKTLTAQACADIFPGRTESAVKSRLLALRQAAGTSRAVPRVPSDGNHDGPAMLTRDDPGQDDGEFRQRCQMAARGSAALLARMAACYG